MKEKHEDSEERRRAKKYEEVYRLNIDRSRVRVESSRLSQSRVFSSVLCRLYRLCRQPLNLGLGRGLSVLELLAHWERVTGTRVPHRMAARRYGDVPTLVCDGSRGQRELSWTPQYDIDDMCEYLMLYC